MPVLERWTPFRDLEVMEQRLRLLLRNITVAPAESEKKEKTLRLHERLEATFERSFQLPAEADGEHLKAIYGKGILTLHVPKTAQPKTLKIPIGKA